MKKKTVRFVLDAALTVMIVLEMFIQFTGEFLHEIIGFAFFATLLVHLLLSAKWIKNTASTAKKGKMTSKRTVLAIMGILLAVNMLILGVSSVAISGILSDAGFVWAFGSYAVWATIHAVSSYTLCALVALHLGMHWIFLASVLHVPYNPERRRAIGTGVNVAATAAAVALGAMAVNELMPSTAVANSSNQTTGSSSTESISATQDGTSSTSGTPSNSNTGQTPRSKSPSSGSDSNAQSSTGSTGSSNQNSSSSSNGNSSASDSSDATGICNLCRKQCPLSAPQCNKPYEAGLL